MGSPARGRAEVARVLLVAHQYWPTPGSATQRLTALVSALHRRGAEVDVVTSAPPPGIAESRLGPAGERVFYTTVPDRNGPGVRRAIGLISFARDTLRIGQGLDYSVVVSDPPPTAAWAARRLARRRNAPFHLYFADTWAGATGDSSALLARLSHPLVERLEKSLLASASGVVAVTTNLHIRAQRAGATETQEILNGIPIETFSAEGEKWYPSPSSRPFFLYAGNAGVVHGADVFVRAAAELWAEGKDFDLVYMGHGQDMEGIASLQKSQESRLWLVPPQPAEVVAAAYRGAIGALSSLRPFSSYEDARPIKTMSGLAAGCPPVYAGGGRFAEELAARELGFVDEWSVEGAKRAMLGALQLNRLHPDKALEMRDRCAVFARDFLDDRHAAEAAANFFLHGSPKS